MDKEFSKKSVATETEIGSNVVGHHSDAGSKGEGKISPTELNLALEMSQKTIAALRKELETLRAKKDDSGSIDKLTEVLKNVFAKPNVVGPTESDNINRSRDYREFANTIDGQSLMEAQSRLTFFKGEERKPISIPKSLNTVFGPSLVVSVNGVRVAIPVDGKTYFINYTHWLHARERMAKVDRNTTDDKPTIIETNA